MGAPVTEPWVAPRSPAQQPGDLQAVLPMAGPSQSGLAMSAIPKINVLRSELPPARPVVLGREISCVPGSVVSRTLAKTRGGSLTLFAFDVGQELSEHTAPFDAFVTVLDGAVELAIGGEKVVARAGETVLMPAGIPHAVRAIEPFKMLLSMVREVA
jgi:quercetin dioxygenase-like cupin family protein